MKSVCVCNKKRAKFYPLHGFVAGLIVVYAVVLFSSLQVLAATISVDNIDVFSGSDIGISATYTTGGNTQAGQASIEASSVDSMYQLLIKGQAGYTENKDSCGNVEGYTGYATTITIVITNESSFEKILNLELSSSTFSSVTMQDGSDVKTSYELASQGQITIVCTTNAANQNSQAENTAVIGNIQLLDKVDKVNVQLQKEFLNGGNSATVTGAGEYGAGSDIKLTADDSSDSENVFLYWKNASGNIVSRDKEYIISNVQTDCTYTAVFGYPTVYVSVPPGCVAPSNITYVLDGVQYTMNGNSLETPLVVPKNTPLIFNISDAESSFVEWRVLTGNTETVYAGNQYECVRTSAEYIVIPYFGVNVAKIGSVEYASVESALRSAVSGNTVILIKSCSMVASAEIQKGVTLLIPYDDANTLCTTQPTIDGSTGLLSSSAAEWKTPTAYRTLTMASGANLTINGSMSLSGKVCVYQVYNGCPTGPLGFVSMASGSTITVNSGANLYVWGYITGSGTVTIKNGGTVYENFQLKDWRGGNAASDMLDKSQKVFPSSQYYVQNVEVPMIMEAGAAEYAYTGLVASKCYGDATVPFIGPSGMFNISDGYLVKDYIESEDRLRVDIHGSLTMSALNLAVKTSLASYNMNSANYVLPITNNLLVYVNSGTTTISQDMAFLPGSEMIIASGAKVTLASGVNVFVYDIAEWSGKQFVYAARDVSPLTYVGATLGAPKARPTMDSAKITVSGTLDASAGYLYTTSTGASICGTDGSTIVVGAAGTKTITYQATQVDTSITFVNVAINAANLKNGAGVNPAYIATAGVSEKTTYYYGHDRWHPATHQITDTVVPPTCIDQGYTLHACPCGYSVKDTYTDVIPDAHVDANSDNRCDVCDKLLCSHEDTIVTDEAVDPTCSAVGKTEGSHCSACGTVIVAQQDVAKLPHTEAIDAAVAPDCTNTGLTEGSHCSVCGETIVAQTVVPAKGHSGGTATCTALATCGDCGVQYGDFAPHSYTTPVVTFNTGYTTYTVTVTCSACGGTSTSGDLNSVVTSDPGDCRTNSSTTYTASGTFEGCEYSVYETVMGELGSHSLVEHAAVTPTCVAGGNNLYYTCSIDGCGKVFKADRTTETTVDAEKLAQNSTNHTNVVTDAAVAPTCTETGLTAGSHCEACGNTVVAQEVVAATGHNYNAVVTAPTCTAEGYTTHTCSACGDSYKDSTVAATGHNYNAVVTAPTCTAEGYTTHTCSACGDSYKDSTVAATGHNYNAVVTAPTCTAEGYTTHTCSVCGDSYTDSAVDALGHDMVTDAAVAPDCTNTGLTEGKHCSRCDGATTAQEVVPALGHDMVTDAAVAPDCTNTGLTEGEHCSRCDGATTAQEVVPALGHDMVTDAAVAPDCTNTGLTEGKHCSRCDGATTAQEVVPALGHSYNSVVTAPTCTAQGYTTHTCSVCGDSYKDTYVDAKGHTEVIDAAVDPTCTDTGLTEGKHCSVCGTVTVAQTVVDALGHSHNAVVTAPTCTDKGYTTYTCSACSDSYVADEVAALGHSYNAVVTAPTCTDKGYTTYTCSACSDSYVADEVAALGHSYNAVVTAPTCTAQGYTTYTCSVCGDSYVADEVAATGHGYTAENTEPTFEADGFTTYTCACGDSYVVTHEGTKLNAVAQIGSQKYQTFEEAFNTANPGDVITLLADVELEGITNGIGITIDLNGNTLKGTYLGTLAMNGGTLITAEGYKMAGPEADYYMTEDAVFTMSPIVGSTLVDVTVHSGTMTIVPDEWWTGKGQTITIESGAKLVIPAGKTMQVLSTVVVKGTVTVEGTVNLYDKDATIAGPEGLNVVTSAGDTVLYVDGTYKVHDHAYEHAETIDSVDGVGGNVYRCDCSDEYTVETYVITFIANDATVSQQILEKGSMPEIPADPTKAADAQYTYTFAGWDAEVALATAPATYTAKFDKTVNEYTVTFVDFFGNQTTVRLAYGEEIAFPETITETKFLNVTFLGWKKDGEAVLGAQSVVGDATYVSSYSVDSIKFGAIWMHVAVDTHITATIFVEVDFGVDLEGEGFTEITLEGAANKLYQRTISMTATQINDAAFKIGVIYKTPHGNISKEFSSLILTYMEALNGAQGAGDNDPKELVTNILAYGSAVREYFYNDVNVGWTDLTVSSDKLQVYYSNYNITISKHAEKGTDGKKYVDLKAANVQFQTDYTMRYYFELNGVDYSAITSYGVIISDGTNVVDSHDFEGKPIRDSKNVKRYMVLYEVKAQDITDDLYVTVYVKTADGTYESDTMQYGLYKYLIRQIYMYSLTPEQGGKRVTGDTDGEKTRQYVAMLNSLLKLGEAYNDYTTNTTN